MQTVAVLGAGNMGTALAQVIAGNGHRVRLWSIEEDVLEEIRDARRNTKYLEGIDLDERIEAVWEMPSAVDGADLVVISVPSQVVARVGADLSPHLGGGQMVLNVAKGLEARTHRRMSEILQAVLHDDLTPRIGSLGGPAIAIEMARGQPMALIVGMTDVDGCTMCQGAIQNEHVKVEKTTDVVGVEMCATLKNVYAISLGMCDGLGFGANTKAFMATTALEEMSRICTALGGQEQTVFGLAGLGDLLTTGYSEHSRNRTLGEKMGAGGDWKAFIEENTVEGVGACQSVTEVVSGRGLTLPLLETIHRALFEHAGAEKTLRGFLREFGY